MTFPYYPIGTRVVVTEVYEKDDLPITNRYGTLSAIEGSDYTGELPYKVTLDQPYDGLKEWWVCRVSLAALGGASPKSAEPESVDISREEFSDVMRAYDVSLVGRTAIVRFLKSKGVNFDD